MAVLSGTITLGTMRRGATVTIGSYWAKKLNVLEGTTPCHVLGIFQGMDL